MRDTRRWDLERLLCGLDPYSDYTFGSLKYWDTQDRIRLGQHDGNLVVRFFDYLDGQAFYSLAGSGDVARTASMLAKDHGIVSLGLLPEPVARSLQRVGWAVVSDRDSWDYVLDLQEWSALEGHGHRSRRRTLNHWERLISRGEAHFERIDEWSAAVAVIQEVRCRWSEKDPARAAQALEESAALDRLIDIGGSDEALDIFALWREGRPASFEVHEALGGGWGVAHFGKSTGEWSDAETAIEMLSANFLNRERGVRWLNVEQDLGLPGLRQRKMHHRPFKMLKKFTAALEH